MGLDSITRHCLDLRKAIRQCHLTYPNNALGVGAARTRIIWVLALEEELLNPLSQTSPGFDRAAGATAGPSTHRKKAPANP